MKTKHFIIVTENGNANFEWVNGRNYPETIWLSKEAKIMTERQKDYILNVIIENGWAKDIMTIEVK